VLSLRPIGGHATLRRAVARQGGRLLALSPWKLVANHDVPVRASLTRALAAQSVIFTSPMAVRAAGVLQPLRARREQAWFAVGTGTAGALRRAGIDTVASPARMDSEGLLALPGLRELHGATVGLVTAPGGRDRIETILRRRGAKMLRADVYARVPVPLLPRAITALRALRGRPWLALSSGGALSQVLAVLPEDARRALLRARVAAASARLATVARQAGFADVVVAASARPADLVAAMRR
jgi:uroporphyrinogen-III synthase